MIGDSSHAAAYPMLCNGKQIKVTMGNRFLWLVGRVGQILAAPNAQSWRPSLLLFCHKVLQGLDGYTGCLVRPCLDQNWPQWLVTSDIMGADQQSFGIQGTDHKCGRGLQDSSDLSKLGGWLLPVYLRDGLV